MTNRDAAVVQAGEDVLFPTIGGGRVELLRMNCLRVPGWDNSDRPVRAPKLPAAAKTLLDARAEESPATIELGVMVRPERANFDGDSFGLALALADKISRFGRAQPWREIIATGALETEGSGRLAPVSGFEGKTIGVLDHIAAHGLQNAIYVFAAQNVDELSERTRNLLDATCQETGLLCMPVSHLSQASSLWSMAALAPVRWTLPRRRWLAAVAGVLIAVAAAGLAIYRLWLPDAGTAPPPDTCIGTDAAILGPVGVNSAQNQGAFGLNVVLSSAKPLYAIGERFVAHITVDHAAYMRVLYLDRNGVATLLYPQSVSADTLQMPSDHLDLPMQAGGPAGPNLLKVIAMASRSEALVPGMRPPPNPEYLLGQSQWQEAAICLKITP